MRLVVFFSRGMSLEGWQRAGMLERELMLYRALRPHLEELTFVTYGGPDEFRLASSVPGVVVLPNRWGLPSNLYSVLAPYLHWRSLSRATVFKTNQLNGAWSGVIAKRLFRRKLVVRCGYLWAEFVARLHAGNWRRAAALRLERQACRAADAVIVAAQADRDTILSRYHVGADRVHVIPNYVDTAVFRPMPDIRAEPGRVTFVGRLSEQKNVGALVDAVEGMPDVTLVIVGDGPLRAQLQETAARRHVNATFLGTRPHGELPRLLNQSGVFVLPSFYEGNPKALVEAMSCGAPVIGARVPGIRELLEHRETGYLCGTSPGEIRSALQEVCGDAALRARMTAGAVAYVRARCSLEAAVEHELAVLRSL